MYTYMQQQKWKEQTVKVVMTYLILNMLKYYLVYSMVIYHLSAPQHSKVPWISPALPSVMPCQCHATPPPTSAPKHGLRTSRSPGLRWSCGSYLWAVVTLTKKNREGLKPRKKRLVHGGKCPTISYPYSTKFHQVEPQLVLVFMPPPKKNINFHKFP